MDFSTVALIPVDNYDQPAVDLAVSEGFRLLGGIDSFFSTNEKILLKPNMLSGSLPQKAITTHPVVFSAVAKALIEAGYVQLSYGDSPGNPVTSSEKAGQVCGITQAAETWHLEKADFDGGSIVHFPDGKKAKSFYLCNGVQNSDALLNICKMKTHALERITGAVKNLYGCICGVNKAAGHAAYPTSETFADMLADLHRYIRPRFHIMDGITAMEGNGPTSGTPINMNVLLFSKDPVALDTVFCSLIHLDPATVPTCVSGAEAGIGTMDSDKIRVLTPNAVLTVQEAGEQYGNPDFNVFRDKMRRSLFMKLVPLLPVLQPRPRVIQSRCIACGLCEKACPVLQKAVHSGNGKKAVYTYSKCIRCFCCQEMCPAKAITVHRSFLHRILGGK